MVVAGVQKAKPNRTEFGPEASLRILRINSRLAYAALAVSGVAQVVRWALAASVGYAHRLHGPEHVMRGYVVAVDVADRCAWITAGFAILLFLVWAKRFQENRDAFGVTATASASGRVGMATWFLLAALAGALAWPAEARLFDERCMCGVLHRSTLFYVNLGTQIAWCVATASLVRIVTARHTALMDTLLAAVRKTERIAADVG